MYENKLVCSVCGGNVKCAEGSVLGTCLSCGSSMVIPKSDHKKINRINYFRNILSFEKAGMLASKLIEESPEDSAAYWAVLLCEYSIQFVRHNGKFVPVCRKDVSMLPPVRERDSYKRAVHFANDDEKAYYESMVTAIEESISSEKAAIEGKDNTYDVFILSREGVSVDDDLDGDRIYLRFSQNLGFKVFYIPESLKESDPITTSANIVYALKNSRILLAPFRSNEDADDGYLNYAVRAFSKIAEKDEEKLIFPIFDSKTVNFQRLPEKLVWLDSAFDCSDDEFMRELSEKMEKILKPEEAAIAPESIVTATSANKENLIKRAYMFLEDGEFETADTYFDKILDIDVEESRAYIGKLLAQCRIRSEDEIPNLPQTVTDDKNFKKALRFATPEQKVRYESLNGQIVNRIESEKKRISEERQRMNAERAAAEEAERVRRERQNKEERKLEFKRRQEPLKNTLAEIEAELAKTFISGKRKKELEEQQETVKRNLKNLEMMFADIYD